MAVGAADTLAAARTIAVRVLTVNILIVRRYSSQEVYSNDDVALGDGY